MTERVEQLLAALELDEKAAMVAGRDLWHTPAIERAGVPGLRVTDGPNGARGSRFSGATSACFPCGSALGATWNMALVEEVGRCIGEEAQTKGAHVLLAPTVNLHRQPLAGRNFECPSEDPHLAARYAVAYIRGVQSTGVGAAVKHFVANDSEFERMTISSEVDAVTLREVYLQPFEAAVREAGAWMVMSAYNRLHGTYCSEHEWLLTDLLKGEWGFDGVVISDWFGTHSTAPAARGGLDLEMPGPPLWFGAPLADAVRAGDVDEAVLDDKIRRLLVCMERTGALDGVGGGDERSVDDPEHRDVARRAARESFVLLSNDGVLPLTGVRRVAVIGPNAELTNIIGGGSANVTPHYAISPLDGLRERLAAEGVTVEFARGCLAHKRLPAIDGRMLERPLRVELFRDGEVIHAFDARRGHFSWLGEYGGGLRLRDAVARVTGVVVAPEAGEYRVGLTVAGKARLFLDGDLVVDAAGDDVARGDSFYGFGSAELTAPVTFAAGQRAELRVEYAPDDRAVVGGVIVGLVPPDPSDGIDRAVDLARDCDAAIVVVGTDGEWETEGNDRTTMDLPGRQDELVARVLDAQPRTVVVVNAASPVSMPWADAAAATMQAWFPGQEWGRALADVLSGDVSPSGRLPTTIPMRVDDAPPMAGGTRSYPGEAGAVHYTEGLLVGHRWYDAHDIEPRFPFGHGLSYTTFAWSDATVTPSADGGAVVHVRVANTGAVAASEVVQVYVHRIGHPPERPDQELRGFAKVALAPGDARGVEVPISGRAFQRWDDAAGAWATVAGDYEVRVAASSRDVRATLAFSVG
ncbi:MAG TPA: glycoside hydrolase family 3 C-terminal domain-containing protein [Acidimicrobiia bacterium]|nr:glycoside hydrolase family 3 C-terminal domain-containing protein [Acidimicrobiia bacterium]